MEGEIRMCQLGLNLALSLRFPTKKAISLSVGLHEIRCSNRQSSTASNLGQDMRDQYKSSIHCCWQRTVNTSVFLKSEHHSLGVPEKVIGDLDRNTRAVLMLIFHRCTGILWCNMSHCWTSARRLLFVIHLLPFLSLTRVLFLISLCFHRQGASVFVTEWADLKLDAQNEPGVF